MSRGRPFGSMRALPSGRYQVRYLGPDGVRRAAPRTFATKADARRWLAEGGNENELMLVAG